MDSVLFNVTRKKGEDFLLPYSSSQYHLLLFKGSGSFSLDLTTYTFTGNTILCFTPFQHFVWAGDPAIEIRQLTFHGDFYCIEYHKKEVACNGLLFNNIYQYPHISVSDDDFTELQLLYDKIGKEMLRSTSFSESILKAYLQLLLALCSREKKKNLSEVEMNAASYREMADIQNLFDTYFLRERAISFYASRLSLSSSALSKKTKLFFGKTPTQLVQDRVVLEAKKLLHLTHKSVKEIAGLLYFDDEYYFSRYFKKNAGVSPSAYREQVGISIVAK